MSPNTRRCGKLRPPFICRKSAFLNFIRSADRPNQQADGGGHSFYIYIDFQNLLENVIIQFMIISYQGVQSFKVQFGDTVLAFDPVSKKSKFKANNFGADIALISLNHPDMNGVEQVNRGEKEAFVIDGPGEYETKEVFIKGLVSASNYGGEERINTIYTVNFANMNLCFLGALGDVSIPSETKAGIDGVDILFVPIGGEGVLNASDAYKFAVSLEPSIIIPMNYSSNTSGPGDEKSLKTFLKEGGEEQVKPIEKLTIKKKDLEGKKGEVVVLSEN